MRQALMTFTVATLLSAGLLGADLLLVGNKSDDTLDLIDLDTGESRATLETGKAPHEVAVSPNGEIAVVANYGDRKAAGSSLTVVEIDQARVLGTVDLGRHGRPHGVKWISDEKLVVTTEGSAHLLVVNPLAFEVVGEIETAQQISHMVATTPDGARAFVANIGSGSVTAIDLAAGRKLADIETGEGAEGVTLTPDGKEVWVTNRSADSLTVIDARSLEVLATIPCAGFPIRIVPTPDGSKMLVSAAESSEVAVFDTATRKELVRSKLELQTVAEASERLFGDRFGDTPVPVGLVMAPDGKRAYVAATQADVVVVIDPATLEVLDLITAGREPDGMDYRATPID